MQKEGKAWCQTVKTLVRNEIGLNIAMRNGGEATGEVAVVIAVPVGGADRSREEEHRYRGKTAITEGATLRRSGRQEGRDDRRGSRRRR